MGSVSTGDAKTANAGTAKDCGESRNQLRLVAVVMRTAQIIWPRKTAVELSIRTGIQTRACEYWMSRKTGMSADSLAALLRSDEGFQILEAIIGDARPLWWMAFRRSVRRAELRRQQKALQEAIEENEQGDLGL